MGCVYLFSIFFFILLLFILLVFPGIKIIPVKVYLANGNRGLSNEEPSLVLCFKYDAHNASITNCSSSRREEAMLYLLKYNVGITGGCKPSGGCYG